MSLVILTVTGFCMMLHMAASNTLIQTIVDEDKRGRVMSLYTMAFLGVAPLGSLLGGTLADRIGAPATVRISGAVCMVAAFAFAWQLPRLRKLVRPVYEQAGILPPLVPPPPAGLESRAPPARQLSGGPSDLDGPAVS